METNVVLRNIPMSSIKVAAVANIVRGKNVEWSLALLRNMNKRAAYYIQKVLVSAVANLGESASDLKIKDLYANQGPGRVYKRIRFAGRSRVKPYRRLRSNIFITVTNGK